MNGVFSGREGLRVGWRVLVFVVLYVLLDWATNALLNRFASLSTTPPIPSYVAIIRESSALLVVLCTTWLMARMEGRRFASFGYESDHRIGRIFFGIAWGFLSLSVLVGLMWMGGFLIFQGISLHGSIAWREAAVWALVFLMIGILEESVFRGYLQHTLSGSIGFWWAAFVVSGAFILWHTRNEGETVLGLLSTGAGSLAFSLSLWYTRSLWWAIGFHAGWDWGQSYFYGTPDSGKVTQGHLLSTRASGAPLWSGGTVGPEGSAFLLPLLLLLILGMWFWWGVLQKGIARRSPEIDA